ncbi:MAG: DUF6361 family protein [Mycetocola sp.]
MASLVAWLDASSEDQRRMREIVNLFSEKESRDELGIGQIRDALSDTLFPGTSTLLTRARYMVLIPWCFVSASRPGLTPDAIAQRVETNERDLIASLKLQGETEGLLGRTAGRALKTLPSSIYWAALRQYGILRQPTLNQADAISLHGVAGQTDDTEDRVRAWSPTLPPHPANITVDTAGGFALSASEAQWLIERMLEGTEGTVLAHLLDARPQPNSAAPWADLACAAMAAPLMEQLQHARNFSFAMHGASLLYNLLLAEEYERAGFDQVVGASELYRDELTQWQDERFNRFGELTGWDRSAFWHLIAVRNPRVAGASRLFVDRWLDIVTMPGNLNLESDLDSRNLITRREFNNKGAQARLRNRKLLASWQGGSGARPLVFRWPQVRTVLNDIHNGLESPVA